MIIKSALYIDFDNMAVSLINEHLLSFLMSKLDSVIKYLETAGISKKYYENSTHRIFYKKIVFYNPDSFELYNHHFQASGVTQVSCPVLTQTGKTSSDMYLCSEILKDLYTKDYDDFVLISADVDFAPVLTQINNNGRRSIQLGLGPQTKLIQSSALISLNQTDFINQILNESLELQPSSIVVNKIFRSKSGNGALTIVPAQPKRYNRFTNTYDSDDLIEDDKPPLPAVKVVKIFDGNQRFLEENNLYQMESCDQKELIDFYCECRNKGIQKRFVTNVTLNKYIHRKNISNDNSKYKEAISFVRFLSIYLANFNGPFNCKYVLEFLDSQIKNKYGTVSYFKSLKDMINKELINNS